MLCFAVDETENDMESEEASFLAPVFLEKPNYKSVAEGTGLIFKAVIEASPIPQVILNYPMMQRFLMYCHAYLIYRCTS